MESNNVDHDDPRFEELSSLQAIYPELRRDTKTNPFDISLELPITLAKPVTVIFVPPVTTLAQPQANQADTVPDPVPSHILEHLPSLQLQILMPDGYPEKSPPRVYVSAVPNWLPQRIVSQLESDSPRLWDELGRDMVIYSVVDHIQQEASQCFGLLEEDGLLRLDSQHRIALLDFDIKAKQEAFEREIFDCGICLDPKKGSVCHRMRDCSHVFCKECLQDFYHAAIKAGDLTSIRCPAPGCVRGRQKAQQTLKGRKQIKPIFISPGELLEIPIDHKAVHHYVNLKYKVELELDKNTVYCPRPWCTGAARSAKHRKPDLGFLDAKSSGEPDESDNDDGDNDADPVQDRLAVCEDCGFAFCSRCLRGWHGEYVRCKPKRDTAELTAEEAASLEYVQLHTTPCPTCAVPVQKTDGCNHMICYRCNTHFCYLCSAWLDPSNPYRHFNIMADGTRTGCFMRLWELEEGDGDNVGLGFAGGVRPAANLPAANDDADDDEPQPQPPAHQRRNVGRPAQANAGVVRVAREGPLVLRIDEDEPRLAHVVPPEVPDAPPLGQRRPQNRRRHERHPILLLDEHDRMIFEDEHNYDI